MNWDILKALGFMALGGLIAHISWLHAWRMYKSGKQEGRGIRKTAQSGEPHPYPQSVAITEMRRSK